MGGRVISSCVVAISIIKSIDNTIIIKNNGFCDKSIDFLCIIIYIKLKVNKLFRLTI